jgi:protein-tyrosine phosphatase
MNNFTKPYTCRALTLCTLLAATFASPPLHAGSMPLSDASVERSGTTLTLHWRDDEPVDVYASNAPYAPAAQRRLISRADADGRHEVAASEQRQYFYLEAAGSGDTQWTSERVLPLEGGFNFRDMGGYPAADGLHVRWGQIYRSGTMVDLTDSDYQYLGKLGIRVVCDFRARQEREEEPTRWPEVDQNLKYQTWDYEVKAMRERSAGARMWEARTAEQAREGFKDFYRFGSLEFKDRYAQMFDDLAQGNAPLAFNCSAGKDRTGRAAALILTALGVPRETIVADYAMTEKVADFEARRKARAEAKEGAQKKDLYGIEQMPPEVRAVLMRSDPDYIIAMLDQMEKDYGSVLAFIQRELSVTDQELAELRRRYLVEG